MPVTEEEKAIQQILDDYISPEMAKEITERLNEEVGENTEDRSLKSSLKMFKKIYEEPEPTNKAGLISLWCLVAFHACVLIFNLLAIFLLPFLTPWYVSLPIITVLVNLMFSPVSCPLTRLESRIRRSLSLPEIRHFIKYYVVDPIRKWRQGRR
jgi:hypothetical protein